MIARPLGAIELDPLIAEARRRMRRRRYLAILALAGIAVAAAALTLGRGPGRSSSWRSTPSETAASAAAFRHVNWGAVTLPGSVCRGSRPIHLHRGGAIARATRPSDGLWHEWPRIYVAEIGFHPTYGMLGGRPAVGLVVGCNNGGGTADGYMAYAAVIFLARRHAAPVVAGVVTPHIRPWGGNRMASLLSVRFRGKSVIAHEGFYGGSDGSCCDSGRATTVWRFYGDRLERVRTTVTRKPQFLSGG